MKKNIFLLLNLTLIFLTKIKTFADVIIPDREKVLLMDEVDKKTNEKILIIFIVAILIVTICIKIFLFKKKGETNGNK